MIRKVIRLDMTPTSGGWGANSQKHAVAVPGTLEMTEEEHGVEIVVSRPAQLALPAQKDAFLVPWAAIRQVKRETVEDAQKREAAEEVLVERSREVADGT